MSEELVTEENEKFLHDLGIKVNPNLPSVEAVERPRLAAEVAKRASALSFTIRIAYGYPIDRAKEQLASLGL